MPLHVVTTLRVVTRLCCMNPTGIIEVYVESKPTCTTWNSGNAVIGIQDGSGTNATVAPGRNTGPWDVSTPEAWRFSQMEHLPIALTGLIWQETILGTQQILTSALM